MFDFDTEISRRNTASLKWDVKDNELPMWVADMDFPTATCVKKAILDRAEHGIYGYSIVPDSWYEAFIGWWKRRHGLTIEKDWLQFATGIVPAISSIVNRITNVGDNVVVLTPAYDIFFHSIENFGRHTLESKLDYNGESYSIDFDDLENALSHPLTTMLILCNPHNPVGKIWTKDELSKIGKLCKKYGVTVLSDEIHCDLVEPSKNYTPFASVSSECRDNSITCISASKAFNIAGLQSAAVMIADPVLRNKVFRGLNSNEVAEPNCFAVASTVAALTEGEEWLTALNEYITENKRVAAEAISKLPLRLVKSEATYLLWIDCSAITDDTDELCDYIRATTGLYVSAGSQYRGNGSSFVRMNIACPRSRLLDGLNRLKKGIMGYQNR